MWTQTYNTQVRHAKFCERFETEVLAYPKGKYLELERKYKMEREEHAKLKEEHRLLQRRNLQQSELSQEITRVNKTLEKTADEITATILPQHQKIINLKKHVASLYQKLGDSESQSWYKTLLESNELEHIGGCVEEIVRPGQQNQENSDQSEKPGPDEEAEPTAQQPIKKFGLYANNPRRQSTRRQK